ncbi:armadillo-type protein [Stachybotrys elegans]|uniref:Armadillo-type protein n=1 Tax=Stachybotrys elegans TaxID=80388 RepID=A0A8K0SM98_9HYPO|nr:armadillo-type protein [Stachybotrys elegans]
MVIGDLSKNHPVALGELQQNYQELAPRLSRPSRDDFKHDPRARSASPTKNTFLKHIGSRDTFRQAKSRDPSPEKAHKAKSSTNLAGLLSRPKSLKNLNSTAEEQGRSPKDKENRTPDDSLSAGPPPPIYAQFTSDASVRQPRDNRVSADAGRHVSDPDPYSKARPVAKERPKSFQVAPRSYNPDNKPVTSPGPAPYNAAEQATVSGATKTRRNRVMDALNQFGHARSKSVASSPVADAGDQSLNPQDIDRHLEAMLDRRNIPENQRYKMRNLNATIKMEFIRQDWAEMQAAKAERPNTNDSYKSNDANNAIAGGSDNEEEKPRRTRGKSFTFSRGKKDSSSPTKKQKGDGTLGRHFRSKSTESISMERPGSSGSSPSSSLLSKIKLQQGPADYVAYLRKVQKPELVEVGKLHKLRLLLRNETVAWIEEFIQQGGMKEIVGLLTRIMEVEWREEHEDALLHENLLCLKALSTTARAMQYLDSIQTDLFPKLLHMLFDPERKGPSEFTTRNIITSVLFTYIESAPLADRPSRAQSVLGHLRDPELQENERPVPFVLEMRQDRPYRVWCKEVVSVTKEVFWIFLHNLNVVALEKRLDSNNANDSYLVRHFPQERPPVPAAPYVGGVEWDATNYLASHLDLMNAILACTGTRQERNALRAEFRISGWERCLGGSLRLCKEKFYGSVHDGLRTWVAAASEDGWDVRDVRYGPPPESRGSPKKVGGGQKKKVEDAPKIEMPKLELGLDKAHEARDAWLS